MILEAADGGSSSLVQNLILLAIMFVFLYFLFIRPEQKRRKQLQDLHSSLKIGQRVYAGAIVGTIQQIQEGTCIVKSGNAEVEILKAAIGFVESSKEENQNPIA